MKTKKLPDRRAPKRSTSAAGIKIRRARCKQVLIILNNRIETVELLREEIHPPFQNGDFDDEPAEMAVVRFLGVEVYVPCGCVMFLHNRNEPNRKNNLTAALKSRCSQAGFAIEGTLPDGKYVAMEVSGNQVVVTSYGQSRHLERGKTLAANKVVAVTSRAALRK